MDLVEEAVSGWEAVRAGVIAELENIPEEHFDYRPAAQARSLRELGLHVAEAGLILGAEILRPDGSFLNFFAPRPDAELPTAHTKAEILELLRRSGAETTAQLRLAGETLVTDTTATFRGVERRVSAVWGAVGHEMYHRGQIAMYARAIGITPVLTQQLAGLAAQQAANASP